MGISLSTLKVHGRWQAFVSALAGILLLTSCVGIGYGTHQSDFNQIILFYFLGFAAYGWILWQDRGWKRWVLLAILCRVILAFSPPTLSDDIYRFIWDGRLWLSGWNPFDWTPEQILQLQEQPAGIQPDLLGLLNSPGYYSIYPAVCQALFAFMAWAGQNQVSSEILAMKLVFLAAEGCTLVLLYRLLEQRQMAIRRWLIYGLNPLILIEFCGNLHLECLAILFLCYAYLSFERNHLTASGISFALAVHTKILPILAAAGLFQKIEFKRLVRLFAILLGFTLILAIPIFTWENFPHFLQSVRLYFQTFEFNGSLYPLARWLGWQIKGYNLIAVTGPLLSFLSALILFYILIRRQLDPYQKGFWCFTVYFLFATTVHPWYVSTLVFYSALTSYRSGLWWSACIPLSYAAYARHPFQENPWLSLLEYSLVFFWITRDLNRRSAWA